MSSVCVNSDRIVYNHTKLARLRHSQSQSAPLSASEIPMSRFMHQLRRPDCGRNEKLAPRTLLSVSMTFHVAISGRKKASFLLQLRLKTIVKSGLASFFFATTALLQTND